MVLYFQGWLMINLFLTNFFLIYLKLKQIVFITVMCTFLFVVCGPFSSQSIILCIFIYVWSVHLRNQTNVDRFTAKVTIKYWHTLYFTQLISAAAHISSCRRLEYYKYFCQYWYFCQINHKTYRIQVLSCDIYYNIL